MYHVVLFTVLKNIIDSNLKETAIVMKSVIRSIDSCKKYRIELVCHGGASALTPLVRSWISD